MAQKGHRGDIDYFCLELAGRMPIYYMYSYLILFFVLSIGISFLCSIWEAVLLSITPSYIRTEKHKGSPKAELLKKFKDDIDRPLSAILTLNTFSHTVGAIGVGIQAGKLFGNQPGPLGISWESIIAGLMTLAILILSEIIPKTLGANYWRSLIGFTVQSLRILLWVLAPFVWLSQLITSNLKKEKDKSIFSRADFSAMAQVAEESGVLKTQESRSIKNMLRLDSIKVKSIMTPRIVMVMANSQNSLREFYQQNLPLRFSRIPVFEGTRDNVTGILLKDDLLQALLENKDEDTVGSLVRKVVFINETMNLTDFLNFIMKEKGHLSMVMDDFGSVIGLVTLEDLFETILGLEIVDESDDIVDLQKLAREIWKTRAKDLGLVD